MQVYIFFFIILNGKSFGTAFRWMSSVLVEFRFQSINPLFVVPQLFSLKKKETPIMTGFC